MYVIIYFQPGDGCSSCPLTYAPVVDADTGLPFYNDCVAKCQLGPGAKLIAAGSRHGGTTEAGRRRASEVSEEPDFFKLVPAPTRTDAGGEVTADTIKRFANDGYIYVGRTGFIERPEEPAPIGDAKNGTNTAARARASDGNQGGSDSGGPTVSLRMVYPDGDMYMKVWNRSELKSLVKKHTGPKSETAPLSSATVPQVAGRDSSPQSLSRRLLASSIIYSPDDRTEITSLTYPYTAVTLVSGGCTGAMVGSTGRLVLTAAQCVYNNGVNPDAPVGFYSNLQVAPGVYSGGIFNYGAHSTGIAQVQTTWTQGSWDANIALLQLSYHYKACGSLGYGYQCGSSEYSLTTAGYPGDKPSYTMWWQTATVTTDVCTGSAETLFPFDAADGQVGSPFWEASDNTVRFVLSRGACCSGNVAVAITPAFYSIMNDFTSNYILTTPTYILVGGPNRKVFVHCDTTSWVCKGTTTRTSATRFYGHPVSSSNKAALRVPGTSLCLSLRSTRSIGKVNLYPCDITSFSFNSTELWNIGTYNNIPVLRTDNGGFLSWGGSGVQMKTASICSPSKASSCTWRVETA
ncbi:hypothetical protein Vretimale_8601 [Volvox reticuliferus]|uniref:Peptidase S1 domain-containing protein n=1 Tax=Volvox reticuliferus TaxID=1737510 RepID=A0A8J4GBS4_9CHLO|nr:hypothetical protein Vretimale_8601 [Volvox reticuliferus]